MASFSSSILDKIQYKTKPFGVDIAMENLKKIHPKLDETNPITLATLANNPHIPESDRANFREALKIITEKEQKMYVDFIKKYDNLRRDENSMSDISECDNKEKQFISERCSLQSRGDT